MTDTNLLTTIQRVRRRWRVALALRGAAIFAASALVLIVLSATGFEQFGVSPATIFAARVAVGVAALAVFAAVVVLPLVRRVSDQRVALYIEEHEPALQTLLISAIDTPRSERGSLTYALVERAAETCKTIDYGSGIDRPALRRNSWLFAGAAAVALVIVAAGPPALRDSTRLLLLPAAPADAAVALSVSVAPGSDTIARGADFVVGARLNGFDGVGAQLVVRTGTDDWQRLPMADGQDPASFEAVLFDVVTDTEYFVEAGSVRSPVFKVVVADAPYVKSLTLEYRYPAYTGLAARRVDDAGDIVAPKGTVVRAIATPSGPASNGRIVVDRAQYIAMQPAPDGRLAGGFKVLRDGLYGVELPDLDGRFTGASAQHAITVIPDEPPVVRIDKPGRDIKVANVDEVFVSAMAEDDYGIATLELVYSVNGGEQQTKPLSTPAQRTAAASGAHTFFLEEYELQPGDLVSYYVRARDNNAIDGPATASTDIYFIQIRPFSRNYRAAEQNGMPGGGGNQPDPGSLSEQQRQIIAATFNVTRDRDTYTPQGFGEAVTTITLAQERLREQVATLVQRMQQRRVAAMDSLFAQISQLLPQAATEMQAAEAQLRQRQPANALAPEQRALQQLLRAEALYRDVQVQMQQQQQGGGGGGGSMAEDLADLFELERNQLRNQYEAVQRSRGEQAQAAIDDALEKLRELARRQQQEAERQRQAAAGQPEQSGGGAGGAQRRLADEAEENARRLERLARENPSPQLNEAARALRDAADAMRRAATERGGRGLTDANAARERLEEARRRLQRSQQDALSNSIAQQQQRAEALRAQQDRIAQNAERAGNTPTPDQLRQLDQQRSELGAGVAELEKQLDRLSAQARDENRNAARELGDAADMIRDSRLRERIRAAQANALSRNREFNRAQDEQIGQALDRVQQQIAGAGRAAGMQSPQAQAEDAAEQLRQLAQGVEGLRGRAGGDGRQLESELRARTAELGGIQRGMGQQGVRIQPLQDAMDALRSASPALARGDRQELDRLLAQVARTLEDVEFDMRRIAQLESRQNLYTASRGQVSVQFRKAVEEYYRALARRPAR